MPPFVLFISSLMKGVCGKIEKVDSDSYSISYVTSILNDKTEKGLEIYKIENIQLIDDDYFLDFVCNLAWKKCKTVRSWKNREGIDITNSNDVIDVSAIIITYYQKNYHINDSII